MRLKSVHPGVTVEQVLASTGFAPAVPDNIPTTAPPTAEQIKLLRTRIDVEGVLRRPGRRSLEWGAPRTPGHRAAPSGILVRRIPA